MTGKELARLAVAGLLGAAIALPAGIWLAGRGDDESPASPRPRAEFRRAFSPDVLGDPYVLDQLLEQVQALEAHCRRTGEMCGEARGARSKYEELAQ
jgi:hypothetical protein